VLVGDVISVTSLTTRFSTSSTRLEMKFLTSGLQLLNTVLGPSRQVNMNRGSHSSTKVCRARVNVTILGIETEVLSRLFFDRVTNSLDSSGQSLKDSLDISTLLHRNDSQLILFIDPDEESLGGVVEDTSALRPVSLHTSNSEVSVSRDEEEMIINKLLPDLLVHSSQRIVLSGKVSSEGGSSTLHQLLNSKTLILGNSRRKTKSINRTSNTDSRRVNRNIRSNVALDLGSVHVRCVLRVGRDSVVLLDDGIEDGGKVLVGVPVTSIDSTVLVIKLNSTSNGLDESKSRGLGFDSLQFLPDILGNVRSNQRVLGLDIGERSISLSWHGLPLLFNRTSRLQNLVLLPKFVDSINHFLNQLDLRVSKSVLVGDVISVTSLTTRFSTSSTRLEMKFLTSGLQLLNTVLGPSRQVNMNRGSHSSTKVCRARVNVTILGIETEVLSRLFFDRVTNSLDSSGQSLKDSLDISTLLHRNDSQLILFIDPDEESLGGVVEDTSALRPVSLHTSNSEVSVSRDEEEMIINKLLPDLLVHSSQRIVLSGKVSSEGGSSTLHQLLNSKTLILGNSRRKTKSINRTSNTDSRRVNRNIRSNVALDLGSVHVRCVLRVGRDSVVLLDDGIEDGGKVLVGVPVTSIDSTVLVIKLNSTSNGLDESKSRGLGFDSLQFLPDILGNVRSNQRVLGLDIRERSIGLRRHGLPLLVSRPSSDASLLLEL